MCLDLNVWDCGAAPHNTVVEHCFEYLQVVCIYHVAVQGIFLYLKLFIICYHCTPTDDDSCNITHFINFFVYRTLDVCGSAQGPFLSPLVPHCKVASLKSRCCHNLPALCLSSRLACFLSWNSYDS